MPFVDHLLLIFSISDSEQESGRRVMSMTSCSWSLSSKLEPDRRFRKPNPLCDDLIIPNALAASSWRAPGSLITAREDEVRFMQAVEICSWAHNLYVDSAASHLEVTLAISEVPFIYSGNLEYRAVSTSDDLATLMNARSSSHAMMIPSFTDSAI